MTDDGAVLKAPWSGLVQGPTPAHLAELASAFNEAHLGWPFEPVLPMFLDQMKRLAIEEPNLPTSITNSTHQLDWHLGMRHHALLMSPIWVAPDYLTYVYHLLANADRFAADYNGALREYRIEQGIHSPGRPMPDLRVDTNQIEAPFWLDDISTGTRQRLFVTRNASGLCLGDFPLDPHTSAQDAAQTLTQFLRAKNLRIAPRALTLLCSSVCF